MVVFKVESVALVGNFGGMTNFPLTMQLSALEGGLLATDSGHISLVGNWVVVVLVVAVEGHLHCGLARFRRLVTLYHKTGHSLEAEREGRKFPSIHWELFTCHVTSGVAFINVLSMEKTFPQ